MQKQMSVKCSKCGKEFKNDAGLRMHDMRTHTGQIRTPGQLALAGGTHYRMKYKKSPAQLLKEADKEAARQVVVGRPVKRGRGGVFDPWTQEEVDLLLTIEETYRDGTNINWKRAFSENPSWHGKLKFRTSLALSGKLTYMKKMAAKKAAREGRESQVPAVIETRPRALGRPPKFPRAEIVQPAQNGHSHVAFCPECGCHIKIWNQVADLVKGLPKPQ
jgi:hypothetical protein